MLCKFAATDSSFNMVSVVVESQVKGCLALTYILSLTDFTFDDINHKGRLTIHCVSYIYIYIYFFFFFFFGGGGVIQLKLYIKT